MKSPWTRMFEDDTVVCSGYSKEEHERRRSTVMHQMCLTGRALLFC